jgi:hypothetical protein
MNKSKTSNKTKLLSKKLEKYFPINYSLTQSPPLIRVRNIMSESEFHNDNGYLVGVISKPISNIF